MTKLRISSSGYDYSEFEQTKRNIFHKKFSSAGFDVGFFDWSSYSEGELNFENRDGTKVSRDSIDSADIIYISALGPIENKESQLVDFFRGLRDADGLVVNDPYTMEENLDKKYLLYLQDKGVAVVPSVEVGRKSLSELEGILESDDLVLKPRIFGERSNGVVRASELSDDDFEKYKIEYGDVLAQPFLNGIIENGERSLVFVGDKFSHGIYRHRADWQYVEGTAKRAMITPSKEESKIIENVLEVWPWEYHVSRFDFITDKGRPMISEVEMVNPNVWVGRGIREVDDVFVDRLKDYFSGKSSK